MIFLKKTSKIKKYFSDVIDPQTKEQGNITLLFTKFITLLYFCRAPYEWLNHKNDGLHRLPWCQKVI